MHSYKDVMVLLMGLPLTDNVGVLRHFECPFGVRLVNQSPFAIHHNSFPKFCLLSPATLVINYSSLTCLNKLPYLFSL